MMPSFFRSRCGAALWDSVGNRHNLYNRHNFYNRHNLYNRHNFYNGLIFPQ